MKRNLKASPSTMKRLKDKGDEWFSGCKEIADWTRKKLG